MPNLFTIMDFDKIPENKKRVLLAYPIRNDVKWQKENGVVIITFKKNFTRFERFLSKYLKGPEDIRLRLDECGTRIWELCDGNHAIKDILLMMDKEFKEKIEPVDKRVSGFLEILLKRGLISLKKEVKK